MKKRDRKLVKKAGERETLLRQFTSLKPAWDYLFNHEAIVPTRSGHFFTALNIVNHYNRNVVEIVVVYKQKYVEEDFFPPLIVCRGKTFEKAIIKLANIFIKRFGNGQS